MTVKTTYSTEEVEASMCAWEEIVRCTDVVEGEVAHNLPLLECRERQGDEAMRRAAMVVGSVAVEVRLRRGGERVGAVDPDFVRAVLHSLVWDPESEDTVRRPDVEVLADSFGPVPPAANPGLASMVEAFGNRA